MAGAPNNMVTKKTTPKIQDAPFEGQVSKEKVQDAIKAAKKTIDPGRPVARPMASVITNTNWGKPLTKQQLTNLLKKLDAKKKAKELNKITEKKKTK